MPVTKSRPSSAKDSSPQRSDQAAGETPLVLYSYFRSSASWRVRACLEFKELKYEIRPVHLLNQGGEQHFQEYRALNPMGEVPTLIHGSLRLGQSLAIIRYLDRVFASRPVIPSEPVAEARVWQICECINSGIHPVQNLKVLQELGVRFGADQNVKTQWARHWITNGLRAIDAILSETGGQFSFGDSVTAADFCLVPQVYNARRYEVDLSPFEHIQRVEQNCLQLQAFRASAPDCQPDTPPA